jgi:demethylmenaquinone methyltransferase/2-methoxy-6-polyprenyl-1,4-benzoquinol methylase
MLNHGQGANLSEFLDSDKGGLAGGETDDVECDATRRWTTCDRSLICQRYNRIAPFIALFDWAFFLPFGLRKQAADRLKLHRGDRVLEVGCGTGRNFPFLQEAVGAEGRVYGIDLSAGMLREARSLCRRQRWPNVFLIEGDAADYASVEPFDGVLFSFSYNTMPQHRTILRQVWNLLRPGGHLVIVDAKLPRGYLGRLTLPFALWLMKRTLLGNPFIRPWEHHAALVEGFQMEEFRFGAFYICWGTKPGDGIARA